MQQRVLKVHPADNVIVALTDLQKGEVITFEGVEYELVDDIAAKHKFLTEDRAVDEDITMYGVLVGKAKQFIPRGGLMHTFNTRHASEDFGLGSRKLDWEKPDTSKFKQRTFMGYPRQDGSVGTGNYWIVLPMVFCETRNLEVMREALVDSLGYGKNQTWKDQTEQLINLYRSGKSVAEILEADLAIEEEVGTPTRLFPNVDGVKFLNHEMGCGGTRSDAQALCGLLAGYATHPNVAGVTVLSLGCQNAQVSILKEEIAKRDPNFAKPLYVFEQQEIGSEEKLVAGAIKQTFAGLIEANKIERQPTPLSKLVIGLECGGSDGFSGISANPAIGHTSDILVSLGGTVILAEFPELCGVEQELSDRCVDEETAKRFNSLMKVYNSRAEAVGSGFYMNPSPGNIKDGLITDAIKSAGAAKKGGTSPVVDVLDYPEKVTKPGLNLVCTPGNDVESTTAEVASGATVVLFTTGLGTPTGNPITPVIKLSTNTKLYNKMNDIIDINCGTIIDGEEGIEEAGERILDYVIQVASGTVTPHSVRLGQDDFIPWKRGVSL
ncbi:MULTISPECIES: UxaA family hydrolase [unclassified Siphonobacter]|uniref:UxaA family hydrolase n=1 Tax=unclassified Siphonobacter TaxID=2635712 RepID=UPI000CB943D1|nr:MULTISPECIES: altronate dehydratase family protein [unclassified Siphonobacter]MDQ1087585.1 altronate hydrolase [Siphonobacter sp. SORGH_AS_1065]PKK37918.1 altronate hydrolase [Siphonobacter sp. SORGH_AS_0500]